MNSFKNLLIPLCTLILALVIVGGAVYAYQKASVSNRQNDSLITSVQDQFRQKTANEQRQAALAQAQASLLAATTRLAQLRANFSPVQALADAFDSFSKDTSTLAKEITQIPGPIGTKMALANQGLADTLQAWKILLATIPASGATPTQIAQAEQYAQEAQTFLNQIQTLASDLTPSNSGLTQNQIDSLQSTAASAASDGNTTSNDLAVALPVSSSPTDTTSGQTSTSDSSTSGDSTSNSSTGTTDSSQTPTQSSTETTTSNTSTGNQSSTDTTSSGTASTGNPSPVTAADVAAAQQQVDQLQQQVDQLQQQTQDPGPGTGTTGTTAPPGTTDNNPPPPPQLQFDQFGRPILIQGTNSDVYHGN